MRGALCTLHVDIYPVGVLCVQEKERARESRERRWVSVGVRNVEHRLPEERKSGGEKKIPQIKWRTFSGPTMSHHMCTYI